MVFTLDWVLNKRKASQFLSPKINNVTSNIDITHHLTARSIISKSHVSAIIALYLLKRWFPAQIELVWKTQEHLHMERKSLWKTNVICEAKVFWCYSKLDSLCQIYMRCSYLGPKKSCCVALKSDFLFCGRSVGFICICIFFNHWDICEKKMGKKNATNFPTF